MARYVELRRHTDNEGDALTADGVRSAVSLGRSLRGDYRLIASSGAQRATQTAACILAGFARLVPDGVIVEPGLRSALEDRWRAAYRSAGAGDLASLQSADPDLVRADSETLAVALTRVFDRLDDGDRALAIGHSPTNEAAIFALTGVIIAPLAKGGGVLVTLGEDGYTVDPVD